MPKFPSKYTFLTAVLAAGFLIAATLVFHRTKTLVNDNQDLQSSQSDNAAESSGETGTPEISGWIAWWKEEEGLAVFERNSEKLVSLSPSWLKLDKNQNLVEIGTTDKPAAARKIKNSGAKLFPMIITDLSDKELADFAKNPKALASFTENLTKKLKVYQADGLDLDFENIGSQYSEEFSFLVKTIDEALEKNGLKFSVVVQARTGHQDDWQGMKGQDLDFISQYADEVRIMAYDRHGEFSAPGPIAPMDWYEDVLEYNLKFIPRDKIVIGLPTYGYVWQKNGKFESFQFTDFISFAKDKGYKISRDPVSSELEYTDGESTAWLSDSTSVVKKIESAGKMGLHRFIIWNLGGTDEDLFEYFPKK